MSEPGANPLDRLQAFVGRRVGVDVRALAALRVAVALLLLADLAIRATDLVAFYTDRGVLPRSALAEVYPAFASLSLHALSGAVWFEAALFALAATFALALLIGHRTRLATGASLVLLLSLHARNPVLLNAGDALLRRLLLWGLFLPLGARWSVDARRADGAVAAGRVATLATAALLLQVVLVYATNAVYKLRGDLWRSGEAIRYVFGLDHLTVLLGDALARFPALLVAADRLWLVLILASPLLLVVRGSKRSALAAAFVGAHLGMALTLRLGLFPLISIAALLPFFHGEIWDRIERATRGTPGVELDRLGEWLDGALPRWRTPDAIEAGRSLASRGAPAVVAVLLALVLAWNAAALGLVELPRSATQTADPDTHRWDMFAPEPRTDDGWYVVPGELESGERVDVLRGGPVSWDRPSELAATFPSHRWFVYMLDLRQRQYAPLRDDFAEYLCRQWNATHEDEVVSLSVVYVEEPVRLEGPESARRVELGEYDCTAT